MEQKKKDPEPSVASKKGKKIKQRGFWKGRRAKPWKVGR